ncbi:Cell wall synthesis protein Wag31 [Corynebacterium ciconiae DSM 44920]|uniref:DivIVA domain-containing protein n=1 Tax=Corynebacterium ciconiae TaxID=227319 RepID=UPI00035D7F05|nr:DivIVA domain-containing protein [Corynebacterium ciconiae]WKD60792.1 Cell wall synthesis protein Wag31 [Corynebacterium ciconiae DSM 44920]
MPLTPADVHNVAFSKPPIGKRGYAEDEVDQFLDLVEDTLGQLQDDNDALRAQVEELQSELDSTDNVRGGAAAASPAVNEAELRKRIEKELSTKYESQLAEAKKQAESARKEAEEARKAEAQARQNAGAQQQPQQAAASAAADDQTASPETHMQAARVLGLAQEMADRLTNDARNESQSMLDEARATAEKTINEANETSRRTLGTAKDQAAKTIAEANEKSERMLSDAKQRSETMIHDATAQSDAKVKQAEQKASSLQSEADRKYSETMATMKQQQSVYENRIDELRVFEREYRTRLKNLLETKLQELDTNSTSAPNPHNGSNN